MIGLVFVILVFACYPLIRAMVKSANSGMAKTVDNASKGMANATNALPSMGASFSASQIADTIAELPALKAAVGCDDDSIKTVIQLQSWMEQNGMM